MPVVTDEASAESTPASVGSEDPATGETPEPAGTGLMSMEVVRSGVGGRQPGQMPAPAGRDCGAAANHGTPYSTGARTGTRQN